MFPSGKDKVKAEKRKAKLVKKKEQLAVLRDKKVVC